MEKEPKPKKSYEKEQVEDAIEDFKKRVYVLDEEDDETHTYKYSQIIKGNFEEIKEIDEKLLLTEPVQKVAKTLLEFYLDNRRYLEAGEVAGDFKLSKELVKEKLKQDILKDVRRGSYIDEKGGGMYPAEFLTKEEITKDPEIKEAIIENLRE